METIASRLKKVLSKPATGLNTLLLTHYIFSIVERITPRVKTTIDEAGNLFFTKGTEEIYPCVTAHLDTVHSWGNVSIIETGGILTSPHGIGGDDKCGIFICLELLRELPVLKVALFQQEEHGCAGSKKASLDWFEDCGYILAIDRRGNSDFITTYFGNDCANSTFRDTVKPVMKQFKYTKACGTVTDVFKLAERGVGISCCNLSCGYHDPHQDEESVVISEVIIALQFTAALIETLGYNKFPNEYKEAKTWTSWNGCGWDCKQCKKNEYWTLQWCIGCTYKNKEIKTTDSQQHTWMTCSACERWKEVTYVKDKGYFCSDCKPTDELKEKTKLADQCVICGVWETCELSAPVVIKGTKKCSCFIELTVPRKCDECKKSDGESCKSCPVPLYCRGCIHISKCLHCLGYTNVGEDAERAANVREHNQKILNKLKSSTQPLACDICKKQPGWKSWKCNNCLFNKDKAAGIISKIKPKPIRCSGCHEKGWDKCPICVSPHKKTEVCNEDRR